MKRHTEALKARLETIPALKTKTFVTLARYPYPDGDKVVTAPYIVLHPSDGTPTQERVTGPRVTEHPRFTIHSVGEDYDQTAFIAELVKAALIVDGRPIPLDVPGETCQGLFWQAPVPIQVDADTSPPTVFHIAEVGWTAQPKP